MHDEILTYEADGLSMRSQLYVGEGEGRRPGVLVFPEAFGLGEHARAVARKLAGLGYAALACDLHGEARETYDFEFVMPAIGALRGDPQRTRARAQGAMQALAARPEADPGRIAAIGFCFGGTMALELARSGADTACTVGFHSGLATVNRHDARNIKGKVLVCLGADDPSIDAEQRGAFEAEMRDAGVDWQIHLYGGVVHSFTNPDAGRMQRPQMARYDARAEARSWAAMKGLFDEVFVEA